MKIDVLDHGFVRLVSYMQPVPEKTEETLYVAVHNRWSRPIGWTGDLEIVRNARVSYDADWRAGADEGKDERLINRMMEGHHSSPFEAMVFTFEVKAPIFIFRQWHRHRTWSYNEMSARYTELPEEFYVPKPAIIGKQSITNKQARILYDNSIPDDAEVHASMINHVCTQAFGQYRTLLGEGVPRELARGILPLNTYSRMFATVDLHNLFHFLRLRLHKHAQWEIQTYANALLELIKPIVPVATGAFLATLPKE